MDLNRRKFCKASAFGAIAMALSPGRIFASASENKHLSGRCTIEVLRCNCFHDLQCRYLDDPEAGPCPKFHVGDKIEITPGNLRAVMESGKICSQAWDLLRPLVMAALTSGETRECNPAQATNEAIVSCPDGTRPVIFKVTAD